MMHSYSFTVGTACEILGVTRQAYYKSAVVKAELDDQVIALASVNLINARKKCPTQGCRRMYEEFGDLLPIGRDKSIELFIELGYRVKYPKWRGKATQSGTREFPNLLVEKDVTGINQVWQADMAHYLYGDSKLYTIYITDVYSQEIVGHGGYDSNIGENYVQVMKDAIAKMRRFEKLFGLIHHSDGGKQYECKKYKKLCKRNKIEQSMCMYSYENPYAEKTNDLINNGYLNVWKPSTLEDLRHLQNKAVKDHNTRRRKEALGRLSPVAFRNQLKKEDNRINYTLELKPRIPEQPRRINKIKTLILT